MTSARRTSRAMSRGGEPGRGLRAHARALCRRAAVSMAIAMVGLLAPAAAAHAAGPAWRIDSVADTTVAPGGSLDYFVTVTNKGDQATNDVYSVTMTLPNGMTSTAASDANGLLTCSGAGTNVVTCSAPDPFSAALPPGGLEPDSQDTIDLTASVDPGVSGTLTSTMVVSGGGAAAPASTVDPTLVTSTPPTFGVDAFDGQMTANEAGDPYTQAAGHPYAQTVSLDYNSMDSGDPNSGPVWPVEPIKDVVVDLPPGTVGNPTVVAQCTAADLANSETFNPRSLCPPASQVGVVTVRRGGSPLFFSPAWGKTFGPLPIFNMVPPPGVPARFGFNVSGTVVTMDAQVRSNDNGLSLSVRNIPEALPLVGTSVTFWGVPADPSHDAQRACSGQPQPVSGGPTCAAGVAPKAFLRNTTSCADTSTGLLTTAHIDSWRGSSAEASFRTHVPPGYPYPADQQGARQGPTGCENVPFDPSLSARPTGSARAGSPAGFKVDLSLPQSDDPTVLGEADLKTAVVTLPQGMSVSPSSADGLGGCSQAQVALGSSADPACPDASKIGTVTIDTPLLNEPLTGSVYLAAPHDNPFGSLLAMYVVAKGPGFYLKLPGKVQADASTGQLTATFDDNPQLPFSNLELQFKDGPRAPLVMPATCGQYTTHAELTSWSGKRATSDSSFSIGQMSDGSPCAAPGFKPGFEAGTTNPIAGASSPFVLRLTRSDGDQLLRSLTLWMPTGVTGRIATTVLCSDAAANAGTCGDASKIGGVTVGAGAGPNPFYITTGRAYITGPYKGAPFGLSMVVPAVAGPFDLGTVVVRAAIYVDRHSAQLKIVSDPLPLVLQGIPLDLRDLRVTVDRPHFMVNPTSCAVKHVLDMVSSDSGAVAHASERFQVGECRNLSFAPHISMSVGSRGHTAARHSTPLTTTITQPAGQSNLRQVEVTLPTTLDALLPVVNRACTLAQYDAGRCGRAKAGSAVAVTPLLSHPLRGGAYFVRHPGRPLPDLMIALRGEVSLDLVGRVTIPGGTRLRTNFDTIPDAPITRFQLKIVAGGNGPIGVVTHLCSKRARNATVAISMRGQNGAAIDKQQRLHIGGCGSAARKRG